MIKEIVFYKNIGHVTKFKFLSLKNSIYKRSPIMVLEFIQICIKKHGVLNLLFYKYIIKCLFFC